MATGPRGTWALLTLLAAGAAPPSSAEVFVWVDDRGTTHVTNDRERVPDTERERLVSEGEALRRLWDGDPVGGATPVRSAASSQPESRIERLLRGALDDLARGDGARALASLRAVLRIDPARPEAHWYLAFLERQRGRFDSAQVHLERFLTHAGEDLQPWRRSALDHLARLRDERRLVDPEAGDTTLALDTVRSEHFRVQYDRALATASADYPQTVLRFLEEARSHLEREWGVVPSRPTGVVLYGRAAYQRAHRHRFSFETVGFYDGRIHVVSAAHPAGELRSLLFHEFSHALFRGETGGDRPFWLNEGLAEIAERQSRGQSPLSRSDWVSLRRAIEAGSWLPLRRLAPSFAGLDDRAARNAYLESLAAVDWIRARTDGSERAALIAALATGQGADRALGSVVGIDQDGLDEAVRSEVLSRFPDAAVAPAAPGPPEPAGSSLDDDS